MPSFRHFFTSTMSFTCTPQYEDTDSDWSIDDDPDSPPSDADAPRGPTSPADQYRATNDWWSDTNTTSLLFDSEIGGGDNGYAADTEDDDEGQGRDGDASGTAKDEGGKGGDSDEKFEGSE